MDSTFMIKGKYRKLLFGFAFLCVVLLFTGCEPWFFTKPYEYPNTTWVCDDPYMVLEVGSLLVENFEDYQMTLGKGDAAQKVSFGVGPGNRTVIMSCDSAIEDIGDRTLIMGQLKWKRGHKEFVVQVTEGKDQIGNGKYKELVFRLVTDQS